MSPNNTLESDAQPAGRGLVPCGTTLLGRSSM